MIYIGADHRGFKLKEYLKNYLHGNNIEFIDLGNTVLDQNDDYVDFAQNVANKVAKEKNALGVIICGSGIGVSIVANKIKGIRAGLALNPNMAVHAKSADHINILALGGDYITNTDAEKIFEAFYNTRESDEPRYMRRINKITTLEK